MSSHKRANRKKKAKVRDKSSKRNTQDKSKKAREAKKQKISPALDKLISVFMTFMLKQKSELYILENIADYDAGVEERLFRGFKNGLPDADEDKLHKISKQLTALLAKGSGDKESLDVREGSDELKKLEKFLEHQPEEVRATLADESMFEELLRYPEVNLLLSAVLVSLISDLDALLSDYLTQIYSEHSHALELLKGKDRRFTWDEIEGRTSDQIKKDVIREYVRSIMADSFDKQMKTFEKNQIHIKDKELIGTMDSFYAIRNVYVHANGICDEATKRILDEATSCPEAVVGKQIPLDRKDVQKLADTTCDIALQLLVSMSAKLCSSDDEQKIVEGLVSNRLFYLLQEGRYDLVEQIAKVYKDAKFKNEDSHLIVKVNGWIAIKKEYGLDKIKVEVEEWNTSPMDDSYKLAKLCLLDRNDEALELANKMVKTGNLKKIHWLSWPLLENVRKLDAKRHVVDKAMTS